MSTLVERLRAEAERLSGSSIRNGCPDCGIAANVAEEAADALSARPTPPAEIVRYEPMVQPFRGEDVVTMAVVNFGQWVRYEDHAVALAASPTDTGAGESDRIADLEQRLAEKERRIRKIKALAEDYTRSMYGLLLEIREEARAALTPDAGTARSEDEEG